MILPYHSCSVELFEIPAESTTFGLARSSYLCQSALSVPRKACSTKRKCMPTDCPSNRELILWKHLKFFYVVPPLNIGRARIVGISIALPVASSNSLNEGGRLSIRRISFFLIFRNIRYGYLKIWRSVAIFPHCGYLIWPNA
jgi:hypothetical protein